MLKQLIALSLASAAGWTLLAGDAAEKGDPFIDRIVSFKPGEGAGYGQDQQPRIVLGPPKGEGKLAPSDDVLSLGKGGQITLEFVDNEVIDGPGPDLLIFENPFLRAPGDDPANGFFELARVEVSYDGKEWKQFPFDQVTRKGCAGHHPVLAHPGVNDISPTDPEKAGGDPFDLKDVGLKIARFVRITDLENPHGENGTAGFDLDAVAAVHSRPRRRADSTAN